MAKSQFKAIIVGGGPVGLVAAHAFARAGIDFVLLEKGASVYPDLGASLALWPMTLRVLDQLGILERLRPIMTRLEHFHISTDDGEMFNETEVKAVEL